MYKGFKNLLLGGSAKLGQKIIESCFFYNLYSLVRDLCDLRNKQTVEKKSSLPFCRDYSFSMKRLDNLLGN